LKVGIIGSLEYENKRKIKEMIFKLKQSFGDNLTIVSSGNKSGADKYAKKYALELDCKYLEFNPAHTQRNLYSAMHDAYYNKPYNVKYFFQRNNMLAKYIDYVVGFISENDKTAVSIITEAKRRGKKVIVIS